MKQADDNKTGDLRDGLKRPVGRPRTDRALSDAERKRLSRDRLRAVGVEEITVRVDAQVAAALRRFVQFKDMTQGEAVTRILRDRLLRKR